jgi:small-conductance mechanosensitive channel
MDKLNQVGISFRDSITAMWRSIFEALPAVLMALLIMLIGWLVARSLSYLVFKGIQLSRVEEWTGRALGKDLKHQPDSKWSLAMMARKVIYFTVILLFAVFASETLGWQVVTQELSKLIAYLPRIFSAVVIFIVGLYIAGFVKQAIHAGVQSLSVQGSSVISAIVFYVIMTLVTITSLAQAGIDTGAVTANFVIIIGSIFLSFALAFGLGARDILRNMVAGLYTRKSFVVGQRILFADVEGTIESMESVNFILRVQGQKVSLPISRLLDEKVVIISDPREG